MSECSGVSSHEDTNSCQIRAPVTSFNFNCFLSSSISATLELGLWRMNSGGTQTKQENAVFGVFK